ncbi:acyltransferase [Pseudoalteromonas piscicida]|uniref:acyltransferase n=1 Tax=Pseudoalteromonas piscicida TaxID=43662 RepID=UPI00026D0173|nr:acyltransferase [Pseudoalteromonas piscicida]WPU30951.1 acyltransferase [Pseudoalteromonas piscicida]
MIRFDFFYKAVWVLRALLLKPFFGSLGLYSYIGKPIFLFGINRIFLGNRVRIFPNSRIEVYNAGTLSVGNNVSIGQSFHAICSDKVTISEGALISANVFITDTNHIFDDLSLPVHAQPNTSVPTFIGRNCFIGYGVVVQAGTTLGDNCVVGANSTIKGVYAAGSVIVGSPGRVIKTRVQQSK